MFGVVYEYVVRDLIVERWQTIFSDSSTLRYHNHFGTLYTYYTYYISLYQNVNVLLFDFFVILTWYSCSRTVLSVYIFVFPVYSVQNNLDIRSISVTDFKIIFFSYLIWNCVEVTRLASTVLQSLTTNKTHLP
jgi:hypothetical protein